MLPQIVKRFFKVGAKFGLVPAEIRTWTEIPVPVPTGFKVRVLDKIMVQKWTEIWLNVNWNLENLSHKIVNQKNLWNLFLRFRLFDFHDCILSQKECITMFIFYCHLIQFLVPVPVPIAFSVQFCFLFRFKNNKHVFGSVLLDISVPVDYYTSIMTYHNYRE